MPLAAQYDVNARRIDEKKRAAQLEDVNEPFRLKVIVRSIRKGRLGEMAEEDRRLLNKVSLTLISDAFPFDI